jgi:hypothetical protein
LRGSRKSGFCCSGEPAQKKPPPQLLPHLVLAQVGWGAPVRKVKGDTWGGNATGQELLLLCRFVLETPPLQSPATDRPPI